MKTRKVVAASRKRILYKTRVINIITSMCQHSSSSGGQWKVLVMGNFPINPPLRHRGATLSTPPPSYSAARITFPTCDVSSHEIYGLISTNVKRIFLPLTLYTYIYLIYTTPPEEWDHISRRGANACVWAMHRRVFFLLLHVLRVNPLMTVNATNPTRSVIRCLSYLIISEVNYTSIEF